MRAVGLVLLAYYALVASGCAQPRTTAARPTGAVVETITTNDGLHLDARLFAAKSTDLVILLHPYPEGQQAWFDTAEWLRAQGYAALTFDFRGYGASDGQRDPDQIERDVQAAVQFGQARGYQHIVLMGAAMGGTAAIVTAAQDPSVGGVFALSAPSTFGALNADSAIANVKQPLVVVAARDDTSAAESLDDFTQRADLDTQQAVEVAGGDTGTELLHDADAPVVQERLLTFLEEVFIPARVAS